MHYSCQRRGEGSGSTMRGRTNDNNADSDDSKTESERAAPLPHPEALTPEPSPMSFRNRQRCRTGRPRFGLPPGEVSLSLPLFYTCREPRYPRRADHFWERVSSGIRASCGTTFLLSVLLIPFPNQTALPSAWLGNLLMLASLQETLGATLVTCRGMLLDLVPVSLISWGLSHALVTLASDTAYSIIIPPLTALCTYAIMACPWLHAKNFILVVMFVIIASPRNNDNLGPFFAPGLLGTLSIGIAVAVIVSAIPLPSPGQATRQVDSAIRSVHRDVGSLLHEVGTYCASAPSSMSTVRKTVGRLDYLTNQIEKSIELIQKQSTGAIMETRLRSGGTGKARRLTEWSDHLEKQMGNIKILRMSTKGRLLGEEYTMKSDRVRQSKMLLFQGDLPEARQELSQYIMQGMSYGLEYVSEGRPASTEDRERVDKLISDMREAKRNCRDVLSVALHEAESVLDPESNTFAFIVRKMTQYHALFSISSNLADFFEDHLDEQCEISTKKTGFQRLKDSLRQPWNDGSPEAWRLPMKTALGMCIASLWVAVPAMWDIAVPSGLWPGITVAIVNLETTGEAFKKCIDRLWATLLACAYGLLVTDVLTLDTDAALMPTVWIFTFICFYLRDNSRPYPAIYAAASLGFVLFGSIETDIHVTEYITNRIVYIFVGVLIFCFVELFIFPRSSRKMVEEQSFQFFKTASATLNEVLNTVNEYSKYTPCSSDFETEATDSTGHEEAPSDGVDTERSDDLFREHHEEMKSLISSTKRELQPAFDEPSFGLCFPLHPSGFRGLVNAQSEIEIEFNFLLRTVKITQSYYETFLKSDHSFRLSPWSCFHRSMLSRIVDQLDTCCARLDAAYPDGRFRPQDCNPSLTSSLDGPITFRNFEDIRLNILHDWSRKYASYMEWKKTVGAKDMMFPQLIMSLALTTSILFEICRDLQTSGKYLEMITQNFPRCEASETMEHQ